AGLAALGHLPPAAEGWSNGRVLPDQVKSLARHHRGPERAAETSMSLWVLLAVNSVALGGLLFLLSAGFSLIFGLMRIPHLMHGSFCMLGAYLGVTFLDKGLDFWVAAFASGAAMAVIGGLIERFLLRRLAGQDLPQVLLTLGFSFIIADLCLMYWGGDPI